MRARTATSTICLAALIVCSWATAAGAQATNVGKAPGTEDWGYTLETGVFWGQVFGGLSSANDKTTFNKVKAEIWRNTKRLSITGGPVGKSWSGQTQRVTVSQPREGGVLQVGGGIGITRFGFPDEAEAFFGESGFTVTSVMGGVRYVLPPQPRFLVFVQGQAGIEHSFQETALAISPEGGVIVPVSKDLFLTITGGLRTAFYEGDSGTSFELGVGLTFPFGQKK
jgi:hypothetical protein